MPLLPPRHAVKWPDPPELLAAAARAAEVDPNTLEAASTLLYIAKQLQSRDSAAALSSIGSALLALAPPKAAIALELFRRANDFSAAIPGCFGGAGIADHPQYGQLPLDFCLPIPTFMPSRIEPSVDRTPTSTTKFDDSTRLLRFYSPLKDDKLLLIDSLKGTAALSHPFHFTLQLLSENASIPLKEMIAKNVTVGIRLADGSESFINGYVDSFGYEHADGGFAFYEAEVVPWFGLLDKRINSRIYQDMTVLDVIEKVFADYKQIATYVFRTFDAYEREDYIVQYGESDEHFVSRLLEKNGLFYYFEHCADSHVMVISDDSCNGRFCPSHSAHAEVDFNAGNRAQHDDGVTAFAAKRRLHASRITLNTFDFKSPHGHRIIESDTITKQGDVPFLEVYDGNPAFAYKNRAQGDREARRRMEEMEWQGKLFRGESDCRGFVAGHTFKLNKHHWFEDDSDSDNDFLLVAVEYEARNNYFGNGTEPIYSNEFVAIRRKIPYRPRLEHAPPRMAGPQTAIVVGPAGAEIHTDQYGRIKVQFHWDRYGRHDESSSCWIRVSQPLAGQGYGMIAIPRVSQEVLVQFLAESCDRPIVTGRVFNADQPVPYGLPEAAQIIGLRSRSTPGGGGYNEVALNDAKGEELLSIRSQKDLFTSVGDSQMTVVNGMGQTVHVTQGAQLTVVNKDIRILSESAAIYLTAHTELIVGAGLSRMRFRADGIIEVQGELVHIPVEKGSAELAEQNDLPSHAEVMKGDMYAALSINRTPRAKDSSETEQLMHSAQMQAKAEIDAELRAYRKQMAGEDGEPESGWGDSKSAKIPLTTIEKEIAKAKSVADGVLSADGWESVAAVTKDALSKIGGVNGPGNRFPGAATPTVEQQERAFKTIVAVPGLFQKELEVVSIGSILPLSAGGKVIANALQPHEIAFAEKIVAYRGGTLVGNRTSNFPGIDGTLDDVLISMKETNGGLAAVLKHASKAESQAKNAGYSGVDLYVKAPNVKSDALRDFAATGGLSKIPNQGAISNIFVLTKNGWQLVKAQK